MKNIVKYIIFICLFFACYFAYDWYTSGISREPEIAIFAGSAAILTFLTSEKSKNFLSIFVIGSGNKINQKGNKESDKKINLLGKDNEIEQ